MTMLRSNTQCHPLTLTRDLRDFPIGNLPLSAHQHAVVGEGGVRVAADAWISPHDFQAFTGSGCSTMVSEGARDALLWNGDGPDLDDAYTACRSFLIRYPWDLLHANEEFVGSIGEDRIDGSVHPSAVLEGVVHLGSGSRILPGVFIEGNVIIGANCKIGPNCYLRGNTSIGDACHIGQSVEIKNSLMLSRTHVGHLSYVGDSLLGEGVNFGAGTTVSNLRHDGSDHRSMVDGILVFTGRRKFGTVVGDGVHTGIQTAIYPGRKLWPGTTTRPGEVVDRDVMQ